MPDEPTRTPAQDGAEASSHTPRTESESPGPGTLVQSPAEVARALAAPTEYAVVYVPGLELLGELGRGAMGVVYKARQAKLNRIVALKVVLGGENAGRGELVRFLAEAEAVAAVKHPNVVQVHECGEADGRPYMILEYLAGGTLTERLLKPDRLLASTAALQEATRSVGRIARGVGAAHAAGIVHRDLKPANVLFDEEGTPKVTDFGLAKRVGGADVTAVGALMGTPAYMSPEQAGGTGQFVGPPADVWALGVILYESLTGTRPFVGDTTRALLIRVQTAEPVAPRRVVPGVPRDLELICLKCLSKEPHDRYPTANELADDLDRFARGEPISVRPVGPVERAYKWVKRNPAVSGALAAVVLALLVGSGVSLGFGLEADKQAGFARGAAAQSEIDAATAVKEKNAAVEAQNKLATANDELNKALADALLGPIQADARDDAGPTSYEIVAMRNLAAQRGTPVSYLFLEGAIGSLASCKQLSNRAEYAIHAAIGFDPELRDRFEMRLAARLGAPETSEEHKTELAIVASRLDGLSPALAHRTTDYLKGLTVKFQPTDHPAFRSPIKPVTEALEAISTRLAPDQAPVVCADVATTLAAVIDKVPDSDRDSQRFLVKCLVAVTARMHPADAARTLTAVLAKSQDAHTVTELAKGLGAAATRMPPDAATAALLTGIELLTDTIAKTSDSSLLSHALPSLDDLVKRIPANRSGPALHKTAERLAAVLPEKAASTGDTYLMVRMSTILVTVAARMAPEDVVKLLAVLVDIARAAKDPATQAAFALNIATIARRAGTADTHAPCAEVVAMLKTALEKMVTTKGVAGNGQQPLAAALAALADAVGPLRGAVILRDALALATDAGALRTLVAGAAAMSDRLDRVEKERLLGAALVALGDAIKARAQSLAQTLADSPTLFAAFATVTAKLSAADAAGLCDQAVAALADTLVVGAATPGITDFGVRAVAALAEPLAAVAAQATPDQANAARADAARALVRLLALAKESLQTQVLAQGVLTLTAKLPAAAAGPILADTAKNLIPGVKRARNGYELRQVTDLLAAVTERMLLAERVPALAPAVEALTAGTNRPGNAPELRELATALAAVARALGTREAAPLLARTATVLDDAMSRTVDYQLFVSLAQAATLIADRMEPREAAELRDRTAARVVAALDKFTDPNLLSGLLRALEAVGGRLAPDVSRRMLDRAAGIGYSASRAELWQMLVPAACGFRLSDRTRSAYVVALSTGTSVSPHGVLKALPLLHPQFVPAPEQVPPEQLVELLKHPFCVGAARRIVLDTLGFTYQRTFADQWDFVRFARENNLPFKLAGPPERLRP